MNDRSGALQELRALIATYLEGSDDSARASELLDVLDQEHPETPASETPGERREREDREYAMFGTTTATIDEALADKSRRDVAMYAMGVLSNAQERIQRDKYSPTSTWTVADRDANRIRQLINIAKYVIDKAVPR